MCVAKGRHGSATVVDVHMAWAGRAQSGRGVRIQLSPYELLCASFVSQQYSVLQLVEVVRCCRVDVVVDAAAFAAGV